MRSISLDIEVSKHQLLKQRLLERYLDTDEETLIDTLEGITDLHEMIATVIRSALVDEALQSGLRIRLEHMRERLARFEERGAKKRQLALEAMLEAGLSKLEQPDFTACRSCRRPFAGRGLRDTHPRTYWIPQPPKLDRQSLLAQLKHGRDISGVELSNPKPTLAVRTK